MGNILSRTSYAFTTGSLGSSTDTKSWYYGSSSTFGKLCYGISGQDDLWTDSLGNPTYNNETCEEFRWNGRELTYYDTGMDRYYYYSYNADGIRTKKVQDVYGEQTTTYYVVEGTKILSENRSDGTSLYYFYDENDSLVALSYNGTTYYYYKNIFGDILGILDSCGNVVVRYAYDAWGNPISTTGSHASTIGSKNPFRYRGYYYDTESGFYYLNARYYNPEWGRFISVDPVLDTSSAVGCNLFAYCGNDPINRIDPTGEFALGTFLLTAVVGAAVNVFTTYVGAKVTGQSYSWKDAGFAAATGAIGTGGDGFKVAAGVVSGVYSGVSAYQNGASIGGAVISGGVSAWGTTVSISNIAKWTGSSLSLGMSAFTDIVFGTASNTIAAAVYRSAIEPVKTKNSKLTDDSQSGECLNHTKLYCDKRLR